MFTDDGLCIRRKITGCVMGLFIFKNNTTVGGGLSNVSKKKTRTVQRRSNNSMTIDEEATFLNKTSTLFHDVYFHSSYSTLSQHHFLSSSTLIQAKTNIMSIASIEIHSELCISDCR